MQTSFMRTFLLSLLVAELFLTFFFNLHPYHEYTVQHNGTLLKVNTPNAVPQRAATGELKPGRPLTAAKSVYGFAAATRWV